MTMYAMISLTQLDPNRAITIDHCDMVHVQWQYMTIRLNVTGLLSLIDFLEAPQHDCVPSRHFAIQGTPDDGYVLWIQNAGVRLTLDEFTQFLSLLKDAVREIRRLGKRPSAAHLPDAFKLTSDATMTPLYSAN
jgi:hypothetical protein